MANIFLRKQLGDKIVKGHPWVFANEIGDTEGSYNTGDIVEVYSYNGSFIGKGFINTESQIRIRILTRIKEEEIDDTFFLKKIQAAWEYRKDIGYTENCRVFFSESDGLSGLILDKFNDYIILQTLSYGIDQCKSAIVAAIKQIFSPKGIYERNDVPVRRLEGLTTQKGFLSADFDTNISINEYGLTLNIDVANHIGTGHHLDRKDSRYTLKKFMNGKEVLDMFCGVGTNGLIAAAAGAKSVVGVDISEDYIKAATQNASINNLSDICKFEASNTFDYLKEAIRKNKLYDAIILDPPAFTKGRDSIPKALSAYKEINLRALQLLKTGGYLITSSASALITRDQFSSTISDAASDIKRQIRLVSTGIQSADHPILLQLPTTGYYKFLIFQVIA